MGSCGVREVHGNGVRSDLAKLPGMRTHTRAYTLYTPPPSPALTAIPPPCLVSPWVGLGPPQ